MRKENNIIGKMILGIGIACIVGVLVIEWGAAQKRHRHAMSTWHEYMMENDSQYMIDHGDIDESHAID